MKKIPAKFILTRRQEEYLKQGLTHCGVYSLKAILSAYDKDDRGHPKEYQTNWIGRNLFSFAIGEKYYDKIFAPYGLNNSTRDGISQYFYKMLPIFLKMRFLAQIW